MLRVEQCRIIYAKHIDGTGDFKDMSNRNIKFIPGLISESNITDKSYLFIFNDNKLLVKMKEDMAAIPHLNELMDVELEYSEAIHFGTLNANDCYFAETFENTLPKDYSFIELRQLSFVLGEETFLLSSRALHLLRWLKNNKYCSKCGTPVKIKQDENAVICPECGFITYPRISPAIIVAVVKDGQLLLAHNSRFKNGMYSVIAGFVEPGETFEGCVEREVKEEVGIKVKNIKYFGSQPWPFPDSLMVGFTAEYAEGEIKVDENEIDAADWFKVEQVPKIPTSGSIARKLIEWFIENFK